MRAIGQAMVVTTLVASSLPVSGQPTMSGIPPNGVRIRLYDYANLSPSNLDWAKSVAFHLLERAGVQTVWLDCRVSEMDPIKDRACEWGRTALDLQLHILPATMTDRIDTDRHSIGRALITPGTSHFAAAYYQRAAELGKRRIADRYDILGAVFAHEIGHLLLRKAGHTREGLMRAQWVDADLKEIACGELRFSRGQARRMMRAVRARAEMAAQRLAETPVPDPDSLAASGL